MEEEKPVGKGVKVEGGGSEKEEGNESRKEVVRGKEGGEGRKDKEN